MKRLGWIQLTEFCRVVRRSVAQHLDLARSRSVQSFNASRSSAAKNTLRQAASVAASGEAPHDGLMTAKENFSTRAAVSWPTVAARLSRSHDVCPRCLFQLFTAPRDGVIKNHGANYVTNQTTGKSCLAERFRNAEQRTTVSTDALLSCNICRNFCDFLQEQPERARRLSTTPSS
jgi:hypothetical protein